MAPVEEESRGPSAGPNLTMGLLRRLTFREARSTLGAERQQSGIPTTARARLKQVLRLVFHASRDTRRQHRIVEFWKAELRETNRQKAMADSLAPLPHGDSEAGCQSLAFRELRDLCVELRTYSPAGAGDESLRNGLQNVIVQCQAAGGAFRGLCDKFRSHYTDLNAISDDISRFTLRARTVLARFKVEMNSFLTQVDTAETLALQARGTSSRWNVVRQASKNGAICTPRERRASKSRGSPLSEKVFGMTGRFQDIIGHVEGIERMLVKDPVSFAKQETNLVPVIQKQVSMFAGRHGSELDPRHRTADFRLHSARTMSKELGTPGTARKAASGDAANGGSFGTQSATPERDPLSKAVQNLFDATTVGDIGASPESEDILARLTSPTTSCRNRQRSHSVAQPVASIWPEWKQAGTSMSRCNSTPTSPVMSPSHRAVVKERRNSKVDILTLAADTVERQGANAVPVAAGTASQVEPLTLANPASSANASASGNTVSSCSIAGSVEDEVGLKAASSACPSTTGEDIEEHIVHFDDEERAQAARLLQKNNLPRSQGSSSKLATWLPEEKPRVAQRRPSIGAQPQHTLAPPGLKLGNGYSPRSSLQAEAPFSVKRTAVKERPPSASGVRASPALRRPPQGPGSRPQSAAAAVRPANAVGGIRPSSARSPSRPRAAVGEQAAERRQQESIYLLCGQASLQQRQVLPLSPRQQVARGCSPAPRPPSRAGREDKLWAGYCQDGAANQRARFRVACAGARGGA